jgi:hypothetical protein
MIILAFFQLATSVQIDYSEKVIDVQLENFCTGLHDSILKIDRAAATSYPIIRRLLSSKLRYKPLAREIAKSICWEIGVVQRGVEPDLEFVPKREAEESKPLVEIAPAPVQSGLTDDQIRLAARSVSAAFLTSR